MFVFYISVLGGGTYTSWEVGHRRWVASFEWTVGWFLGQLLLRTTVCHSVAWHFFWFHECAV